MATTPLNLTADGSTAATTLEGIITVAATGTFGGGTLTIEGSIDGGTTWVALTDAGGSALTFAANGMSNIEIGELDIRGTLAGSTTPNLNLTFSANRKTSKL